MPDILRKFVPVENDAALGARQIRIIASDATVDRVKDVMVPEGCDLDDYRKNPIVLAQHNKDYPIGRATIAVANGRVEALIDFAPAGISAKADEYCGLAKSGIINAASVGFEPVDGEKIKDGGIRYTKWKLMELSLVSVPANPNATTIARSADINCRTKAEESEWKVGASRNLPIDEEGAWDGPAAEKAIFELCKFDGDDPDTGKARKAFLVYDAANPKLKGSYKLPFATVKDGRLTALASGIRAAASRLPQTDLSDEVKEKARAVIDHYESKMSDKGRHAPKIKGLYEVAQLAWALADLGHIHDMAVWEESVEQDSSKLPTMLAEVLSSAAAALCAMTEEETSELLAGRGIEPLPVDEVYVEAAATPQVKALRAAFRKAGRVMSQANMDHVAAIHKCMKAMGDCFTKAADLHDDLHDTLEEMMEHGTSAGDHTKALMKSAGVDEDNGDGAGDPNDPDAVDADPDNELAFGVASRKRMADVLMLSKA